VRFFTAEVYEDWGSDDAQAANAQAADAQYREHLAELPLPEHVRAVADAWFVDDAMISRLRQSDDPAQLVLTLRCGWSGPGYFDLRLRYVRPEIEDESLLHLVEVATRIRSSRCYWGVDAWCQEWDMLPDGRLSHLIAFHGSDHVREVRIVCADVNVRLSPRSSRTLPPYRDRFKIGRLVGEIASPPE
jgi:hypothetical protein